MKIGIIIGSIRDGRFGEQVANWVFEQASKRDADYQLVDLKGFNVPLLTSATIPGAANKQYDSAEVQAWSSAIDELDGFIFVTPEYNHSVPGGFKNAFDSLGAEWRQKSLGFVSYGADSGVRAVETWRGIVANFSMYDVRTAIAINLFAEFADGTFVPTKRRTGELKVLFDELEAATVVMAALRG